MMSALQCLDCIIGMPGKFGTICQGDEISCRERCVIEIRQCLIGGEPFATLVSLASTVKCFDHVHNLILVRTEECRSQRDRQKSLLSCPKGRCNREFMIAMREVVQVYRKRSFVCSLIRLVLLAETRPTTLI